MPREARENSLEIFYVGTFVGTIYTISLNVKARTLAIMNEMPAPQSPAIFAVDPSSHVLYVGNENREGQGGVIAFNIKDPIKPRMLSGLLSAGHGPCHIALIREMESTYLVGASFFDGSVQAFSLDKNGSLKGLCCDLRLNGSGPYRNENYIAQQDQSRIHCVVPVPNTEYFACTDLGGDSIYVFQMRDGQICKVSCKTLRSGSGPRHIACASSGKYWYLVDELDCCVSVLNFERDTASLEVMQRISALPDSFTGDSWCSTIRLSPDERFLYVGNRGYDSIAVFRVEDMGRHLEQVGWYCSEISKPREFTFDRTGAYLLIGGMDTACITLNEINPESGMLEYVTKLTEVTRPACILSAGRLNRDI